MREEKRKVKDIHGNDLRDFPDTEIIFRPKTGPGGVTVGEEVRIPGRTMPIIEAVRPKPAQVQEEVKADPTRSAVTDRVAVSDSRHVMAHIQGEGNRKVIEGGRMAPHLVPTKPTTAAVRITSPMEQRDDARLKRFIDSLQPEEDAEQ